MFSKLSNSSGRGGVATGQNDHTIWNFWTNATHDHTHRQTSTLPRVYAPKSWQHSWETTFKIGTLFTGLQTTVILAYIQNAYTNKMDKLYQWEAFTTYPLVTIKREFHFHSQCFTHVGVMTSLISLHSITVPLNCGPPIFPIDGLHGPEAEMPGKLYSVPPHCPHATH